MLLLLRRTSIDPSKAVSVPLGEVCTIATETTFRFFIEDGFFTDRAFVAAGRFRLDDGGGGDCRRRGDRDLDRDLSLRTFIGNPSPCLGDSELDSRLIIFLGLGDDDDCEGDNHRWIWTFDSVPLDDGDEISGDDGGLRVRFLFSASSWGGGMKSSTRRPVHVR